MYGEILAGSASNSTERALHKAVKELQNCGGSSYLLSWVHFIHITMTLEYDGSGIMSGTRILFSKTIKNS
jgi:hypothetical protein